MGRSGNRRATARNEQRKKQLQNHVKVKEPSGYKEVRGISKQDPCSFKPKRAPRYVW
ncbi:hypothetical protein [Cetobacterium sp.]|uniref:hypothetical protein n=1 Tax=Cetobacterium sp. TaxID=2071632 RepID=UPI003F3005EB